MRRFFRTRLTHFIWGFAITLVIITAYKEGLQDFLSLAAISAVVGVLVSGGVFFLERRFPDVPTDT